MSLLLFSLSTALARDLENRLGVGVQRSFGTVPTLSVRYGIPIAEDEVILGVEGDLGFAALDGAADEVFAGGRVLWTVVTEDNMNLYAAGGVGWARTAGVDRVRLQPALGAEFFLFGLENLGFNAEVGASFDLGEGADAATFGGPLLGFHYYF